MLYYDTERNRILFVLWIKLGWHDKTFADYTNDEKALKMVRNYIRKSDEFVNDGLGMYLWGSNGTGKSHLLNCAFKRFIEKGYTVRLFSMDELVDKYTSSWYSDEQKQDLTKILRDVQFLGIDEFGKTWILLENHYQYRIL